jgi:AmiR/NasT family two-component response regulator
MTLSILLVDPDADRRTRITRNLGGTDCRIAGLSDGPDEAMRIAADTAPDVALVAATIGNGSGEHLTDRLSGEHGVPVVLVASGVLEPLPLGLAAQAGVMGFLIDPITAATLRSTLEVAVCRFREFRALRQELDVLRQSVEARKVIERAKGLLMEGGRLSEREAYARIRRKSMDTQRPMTEIARAIILSAEVSMAPH